MRMTSQLHPRAGGLAERMAVRRDVTAQIADGHLVMVEGHVQSRVPLRDPGLTAAVQLLLAGPVDEDALFGAAIEHGGDGAAMSLPMLLRRLDAGGWLRYPVVDDAGEVVALEPRGHQHTAMTRRVVAGSTLVASDQAIVRRLDGEVIAESPLSSWDLRLLDVAWLPVLFAFDHGRTVDEVATAHGLSTASVALVAGAAARSGLLRFADEDLGAGADLWSLSDLWFHSMSRVGAHRGGYGGTYHFEGRAAPEPAVRPPFGPDATFTAFATFDPATVGQDDPPFGDVVRARASIRAHDDDRPITTAQLGELLGRVGFVRAVVDDGHQELSFRQTPSGGALHELEIYPLVHHCDGLEPGLYHYDAGRHGLELVRAADPQTRLLLEYSQRTSTMEAPPQVTLLVAARFGRAMWKYESMAYALVLKHVGVMYEALYLSATAMGLACCALGGGNSQAFAAASGLAPLVEGSVGEFVVGSRPAGAATMQSPGVT